MSRAEFLGTIPPIEKRRLEIVERKGIGHPDTLADGVAEVISNAFASMTTQRYGGVLNHNLDKVYLTGGSVEVGFGYGRVLKPATLYVGGRMTTTFGDGSTGAYALAREVGTEYVRSVLPHMQDGELQTVVLTNDYSHNPFHFHPRAMSDVANVGNPRANDTSTMVGCWPPSVAEHLALDLEGFFYSHDKRPRFAYIGQDIKVMVRRTDSRIDAAIALPQLSQHTKSFDEYYARSRAIESDLISYAAERISNGLNLEVIVRVNPNTDDLRQPYLLHNGSCIEAGEEGFTGRGNKLNGVISNVRPISMEAPHGKNPQYFSGKIGTYFAAEIAKRLSETHDHATVQVFVSTNKGEPIRQPFLVAVEASIPIRQEAIGSITQEVTSRDYLSTLISGYFVPRVHSYPCQQAMP